MKKEYALSIVIAIQHAQANVPEILKSLNPGSYLQVQFLFCSTKADPEVSTLIGNHRNVFDLQCASGSLIPELWRDGILAAKAERVALGTGHCIPDTNWVNQLLALDMSEFPGIGGVIVNDQRSNSRDWAIYILRYISFAEPQQKREIHEIAADNAIYRREDVLKHADLLKIGFWEPSFHARFRQADMTLRLEPELRVIHRNRYTSWQFFVQRLAHGKEFGLARARLISRSRRLLLILLSPLLPLLFLKRIISTVSIHGKFKPKLFTSSPWLLFFLLAWGLGEARGYLSRRNNP